MFKTKLRVDDEVKIIAGGSAGRVGKIEKIDLKRGRVFVDGAKKHVRHTRADANNPEGGLVEKNLGVAISNVMLVDPKADVPSRIGYRREKDGKKIRFSKKSGEVLPERRERR